MIAQGTSCDYFERPWRVDLQMRGFSFSTLLTSYMARFQAGSRGSTSLSKSAFLFSKIALITLHNVETSSPPWGRGLMFGALCDPSVEGRRLALYIRVSTI